MGRQRRIAVGVGANWAALITTTVISFFLSPFLVRQLGDVGYGVWVLASSSVSYMAVLDLGLRGAVLHFVAKHRGEGDHAAVSRAVSAALWLRIGIALVIGVLTALLAATFSDLFKIPPPVETAASVVILLTGTALAISLLCGVFGGVLAALERFDLIGAVSIVQTVANATSAVWVLKSGRGLIALGAMQFLVTTACSLLLVYLAFRIYPELRITLQRPDRGILKNLWSYSFYMFILNIAAQLIYYKDNVLVGAFVSAAAVTVYSIAGRLIEYHRQPATMFAQQLVPIASGFGVRGEYDQLRRLLIQGTRIALCLSLPLQVGLFIRGTTFIDLWMGPAYGATAGLVLRILLLSHSVVAANQVSANITFGLGKHKPFAIWQACEAAVNFTLSVILVRTIGITGIAWGTALPSLFTQLFIWPVYISRLTHIPVRSYLWQAWARPAFAMLPFAAACLWAERYWPAHSLAGFMLQMIVLLPALGVGVGLCFRKELAERLPGWLSRFSAASRTLARTATK